MNPFHVVVLSVIEGITEFLPVSSTGHIILATKLLGIHTSEFTKSFDIFIQLGAIMAVVTLYMRRILANPRLSIPILIAFVPTGVLGAIFYKTIKSYLLDNDALVVSTLAGVGLILIMFELMRKGDETRKTSAIADMKPATALLIGLFQSVSMIPGVSRSASTIVGGMLTGLSRKDAVEFSFLLAVPTMAAASGLDLVKNAWSFSALEVTQLAIGFVISWITAIFVIRSFVKFVETKGFIGFGIYRISVAVIYALIMFL